jgi:hypothetical protein
VSVCVVCVLHLSCHGQVTESAVGVMIMFSVVHKIVSCASNWLYQL